jgi:chemotaxis protein methyltransferase CheR
MIPASTFNQVVALIEQRTGLQIDPHRDAHRHQDLASLLTQLEAENANNDPRELLRQLHTQRLDSALWQSVISLLAIGETYFFRDDAQFQLLENDILPALIAERRQQKRLHLALWSAGCATGEEPYSLAIVLRRLLPDIEQWNITLLATDLNERALEVARRGVYRPWSFRLRHIDLSHAFQTVREGMQIRPDIRRMVRFECGHLLDGPAFMSQAVANLQPCFDIVFCRNVLLYFSSDQVRTAEQMLAKAVIPGGWLFLGHSESLSSLSAWNPRTSSAVVEWERQPQIPVFRRVNENTKAAPGQQQTSTVHRNSTHPPATSMIYKPVEIPIVPAVFPKASSSFISQTNTADPDPYEKAVSAYRSYQLDEAEKLARELIFRQPNHSKALLLLAYIAADRQNMAEATSYIERALRQDRLLADAYYLRSMIHREAGDKAQAEAALRAALYCQRDHILTLYNLGTVLEEAGDTAHAAQLWQQLQRVLRDRPAEAFLSDYSDLRVGRLRELLDE